jgi:hypothetical protein
MRATAAASMPCLSASLTPQWGVMSPTSDSAASCTSAIFMHLGGVEGGVGWGAFGWGVAWGAAR